MSDFPDRLDGSSGLSGSNAEFLEALYEAYLEDPSSVPASWRRHFAQLNPDPTQPDLSHHKVREGFRQRPGQAPLDVQPQGQSGWTAGAAAKQAAVLRLINAYRVRGHQNAQLDPLQLSPAIPLPDLDPAHYHLDAQDLTAPFNTGSLFGPDRMTLQDILTLLREVYTGTVGSEYMHITDTQEKRWIQQRLEAYRARPELTEQDRHQLLRQLTAAEGLEKYLHTRYVGQKRFSLEGAEALIPLLEELIRRGSRNSIAEVVIGMAHRGRLNVLTNILGKPPKLVFDEFEGRRQAEGLMSSGDVKYHMGFSCDLILGEHPVHVALGFNPSHLEIIGPVIEGSVRARQQRHRDREGRRVLPVIIHGDAAFAGQGVVMETFNISQARGFGTGGTVHVVVNNQIGFTTSNRLDSRSTTYCTDVAKMVQAPIFHVNGDDPEAVIFVTRLALDYRNRFHKDVVIDLVCYRRQGHNEADEPAVTQPSMYKKIRKHRPLRAGYAEQLVQSGVLTLDDVHAMIDQYRNALEIGEPVREGLASHVGERLKVDWRPYHGIHWQHPAPTALPLARLQSLAAAMNAVPEAFELHPRVQRILEQRRRMAAGEIPADWGFAELLAYASLLDDGYAVRLSGQDVRRGTFFHRHAMLRNQKDGSSWVPLQHLAPEQPNFVVIDSPLSEEAVLAYEYGYATADPHTLTLWEAQFGDFANGAQVVIDQFITSAGAKWGLYCGLVMLLPHGYEGQGPEHSSARLERYLQLCAEHNIQVCVPTTAAQIFHLLRRQMVRPYRHPLVVMTPKSLLRHPAANSPLQALTEDGFRCVIDEQDPLDRETVTCVVMCSGKLYYELLDTRRQRELNTTAIVRIEQLYPFPHQEFDAMVAGFPHADTFVWCQEEPQNQGVWDQIKHRFHRLHAAGKQVFYAGRRAAAAPATGFYPLHQAEQKDLITSALEGRFDPSMNRRMTL